MLIDLTDLTDEEKDVGTVSLIEIYANKTKDNNDATSDANPQLYLLLLVFSNLSSGWLGYALAGSASKQRGRDLLDYRLLPNDDTLEA